MNKLTTSIKLFGQTLKAPLMLGSGTLVERYDEIQPYLDAGIGMVVPRSTRKIMHRKTHPVPHLYQTGTRKYPVMINTEWTGADISYWRPYFSRLMDSGSVVMSVSGRDIPDCVQVCRELEEAGVWCFYEINVSCAHSNSVHGMITKDADHIGSLVTALKKSGIKTPIVLKLGHSDRIVELCQVAESAGADGLVLLNTYGPVFDFTVNSDGRPEPIVGIDGGRGGLSGAPLFHIALTDVALVSQAVNIPVIGCGGVCTAEDVVKMLMAGASAVQIYTAAHACGVNAPDFFRKLNDDLVMYMKTHSISNLSAIIGTALPILDQRTSLKVEAPEVDEETCIGCDLCLPVCLPKAIAIKPVSGVNKVNHVVSIDSTACIGCGHCLHVCPTYPNSLQMKSLRDKVA